MLTLLLLSKFRLVQSSRNWHNIDLFARMVVRSMGVMVALAAVTTFSIMLVRISSVAEHPVTIWAMFSGTLSGHIRQ